MDRIKMKVAAKFPTPNNNTVVVLSMTEPDDVPAIMTWHYHLPYEDVADNLGDMYEVTIRLDEGPL